MAYLMYVFISTHFLYVGVSVSSGGFYKLFLILSFLEFLSVNVI